MELLVIMLLTALLAPVVELTAGPLRMILGSLFLLFFPGYCLIAALFPRKDSMQSVERVVMSFVSSIILVPLVMLILNFTPWHIRLESIFGAVASLIVIASVIALLRRRDLPLSDRFQPSIRVPTPQWGILTRRDKIISSVLLLLIIGATFGLVYVVTTPRAKESFTDFFILGPEGMVANYPRQLLLGDQVEVMLGIVNHEHQDTSYTVQVMLKGQEVQRMGPIDLSDTEEWRGSITLVPTEAGQHQKVDLLLYKGEAVEPYLTLFLWLNVNEQ